MSCIQEERKNSAFIFIGSKKDFKIFMLQKGALRIKSTAFINYSSFEEFISAKNIILDEYDYIYVLIESKYSYCTKYQSMQDYKIYYYNIFCICHHLKRIVILAKILKGDWNKQEHLKTIKYFVRRNS